MSTETHPHVRIPRSDYELLKRMSLDEDRPMARILVRAIRHEAKNTGYDVEVEPSFHTGVVPRPVIQKMESRPLDKPNQPAAERQPGQEVDPVQDLCRCGHLRSKHQHAHAEYGTREYRACRLCPCQLYRAG